MAERLALTYKQLAMPGNVERTYATKVGGETATLAHFLSKAKEAVHSEAGLLELELAANTEGPSGTPVSGANAEKYLANVSDIRNVIEY